MVAAIPDKDNAVVIRFGFGVNSRASEDEIDPRECASGQNFLLDLENREFRNRPPFDLVATAPNLQSIGGFAQLLKADGTTSTLVQAGTVVYEWDGGSGFTVKGTVTTGTKMRGPLSSNWTLSDKVLISDIAGVNPLSEWDGTTFQHVAHNLGGTFISKYCFVKDERAFYANVISNGTPTPHLVAGSKVSDYTTIDITNKPSSALGVDDPFYLLTPDLKPINGIIPAFGQTAISSKRGRMFFLTGTDSTDYSIQELYPDSCASGDESFVFVGNDVMYGRQGRLESLIATATYGNVETDDLSRMIQGDVQDFDNWTAVANLRLQRVYFFAENQSVCWMLQKALRDQEVRYSTGRSLQGKETLSPWTKYVTSHSFAFQPTAVMNMYDQVDGLEYVFMGGSAGQIYRMEGTGAGDGGTTAVDVSRTSMMFEIPLNAKAFNVSGWIKYRQSDAFTVTLTLMWAGENVWNEVITIDAAATTGRPVYSGGFYYSGTNSYYSAAFDGRFVRVPFDIPGQSNEFQLKAEVSGTVDFRIAEIGLRFETAA